VNLPPAPSPGPLQFQRRLTIVTLTLLLVFLSYHLLRELAPILQPLMIAALITYVALPSHRWLVQHGVPSRLGHLVLVSVVILFFFLIGRLAQGNFEDLAERSDVYEKRLDDLLARLAARRSARRAASRSWASSSPSTTRSAATWPS
jgi:predicted PurR-regulated permease PerM